MVDGHQETYILKITNLDNFASLKVKVRDDSLNQFSNIPHVIRCRELLFSDENILACPAQNSHLREFTIILSNTKNAISKLEGRLKSMRLEYGCPMEVDPQTLENCFLYTLQAKLAPAWNRVGKYLLKGRQFLTTNENQPAVEIKASYYNEKLSLMITSYVLKLPKIELSSLGIEKEYINEFLEYPRAVIPDHVIHRRWCFILPTMRRGQILSIRKSLPPDCLFPSYLTLKRHWKNHYGYRLPENEEDINYAQIYFKPIGDILFTYPLCCIRPSGPEIVIDPYTKMIPRQFIEDVITFVPTLMDDPLKFIDNKGIEITKAVNEKVTSSGSATTNDNSFGETSKYFPYSTQPAGLQNREISFQPKSQRSCGDMRLSSQLIMSKWLSGEPQNVNEKPKFLQFVNESCILEKSATQDRTENRRKSLLERFQVPASVHQISIDHRAKVCKKRHLGMSRSIFQRNISLSQPMTQCMEDPETVLKMKEKIDADEAEIHVVTGNKDFPINESNASAFMSSDFIGEREA